MVTATRDRQRAFQETEVHDDQLEALAREHLEAQQVAREPSKRYRRAKKDLKAALQENGLMERIVEERVRVGEFVITGTPIEGGPTDIPEWKSVRVRVEAAPQ